MKRYTGDRTIDGLKVLVDGRLLDPAYAIRSICDKGFEWSYEGAAPAQLALAILADHYGDPAKALALHEAFMSKIVANFDNEWEMTSTDVDAAVRALGSS
ncbi:MAG: hypothetical protein EXR02_04135 [Rhodospirillales bacterium]|nr:hypothetical protein [Rhodospirillales bacterium]